MHGRYDREQFGVQKGDSSCFKTSSVEDSSAWQNQQPPHADRIPLEAGLFVSEFSLLSLLPVAEVANRHDRIVTRMVDRVVVTSLLLSAKKRNLKLQAVVLAAFTFAFQHVLRLQKGLFNST